tara:strand:- start:27 stop:149 length:123 start_codon:yes stop_codon:yes gene_type:complete
VGAGFPDFITENETNKNTMSNLKKEKNLARGSPYRGWRKE